MIEIEGLEEAEEAVEAIADRVASPAKWALALAKVLAKGKRFVASISPVVSGSYRKAHRVAINEGVVELSIDPGARNKGVPVERYAASVEARHRVYARGTAYIMELLEEVEEEMING